MRNKPRRFPRGLWHDRIARVIAMPTHERITRLREALSRDPRCPVCRYVLGCEYVDADFPASAVRELMIAHHAAPDLESASLLVFTGLNWTDRREPLLALLSATWESYRRPEFDRTSRERTLLDAFSDPPPAGLDGFARRAWRLPIRRLREQIRSAVAASASTLSQASPPPT